MSLYSLSMSLPSVPLKPSGGSGHTRKMEGEEEELNPCGYALYMRNILTSCLHDSMNSHLYTPYEIEVMEGLVKEDDGCLSLLTRFSNRKGPWFRKTDAMHRYVISLHILTALPHLTLHHLFLLCSNQYTSKECVMESMDRLLLSHRFLPLTRSSPMDHTMEALSSCASVQEVRTVYSAFDHDNAVRDGRLSKRQTLAKLKIISKSQRTVMVKGEIPLASVFLHRCCSNEEVIFRISPVLTRILRRVARINYIVTNVGAVSRGRLHDPTEDSSYHARRHGLLEALGKMAFGAPKAAIRTSPLFISRDHFLAYEGALALWQMVDNAVERVQGGGGAYISDTKSVNSASSNGNTDGLISSMTYDSSWLNNLEESLRLMDRIQTESVQVMTKEGLAIELDVSAAGFLLDIVLSHNGLVKKEETKSFTSDNIVDDGAIAPNPLEEILNFARLSFHCLKAFKAWRDMNESKEPDINRPIFLQPLSCEWVFHSILWDSVQYLDRLKAYEVAIEILNYLLQETPEVVPSRRGKLWNRLTIDLEHCGKPEEAYDITAQALLDSHVIGGDLISVLRRNERLATKVKKVKAKQPLPALHESGSRWTNCFVCNKNVHMLHIQGHVESHFASPGKPKKGNNKRKREVVDTENELVVDLVGLESSSEVHPSGSTRNNMPQTSSSRDVIKDVSIQDDMSWFNIPDLPKSLADLSHTAISIVGKPLNCTMGQKSRFAGYDNVDCTSVEGLVLQYYKYSSGWTGLHCEGGPIYSLYALLMWEVIFTEIPDVFQTKYQDGPLDLYYPAGMFIDNRKDLIRAVLDQIRSADEISLQELVTTSWKQNFGKCCVGMNWGGRYSLKTLTMIACAIGGRSLSRIFLVLSAHRRHLSGGMPDLLLWKLIHPKEATCSCWDGKSQVPVKEEDMVVSGDEKEVKVFEVDDHIEVEAYTVKSTSTIKYDGDPPPPPEGWIYCSRFDASTLQEVPVDGKEEAPIFPLAFEYKLFAKFSEVKGPRDKLSDRQHVWLNELQKSNVNTEVCHVEEPLKSK